MCFLEWGVVVLVGEVSGGMMIMDQLLPDLKRAELVRKLILDQVQFVVRETSKEQFV